MRNFFNATLAVLITISLLSACKSYEVMHYKNSELDKVAKNLGDYTVYINAKGGTFRVDKPSISGGAISGNLVQVTDPDKAKEIRNPTTPGEIRKHKHDLNLFTKAEISDTAKHITLKKDEITDYSIAVVHSKVDWKGIGNGVATVVVTLVCIASIAGIIYAFQPHD